MQTKSLLLAAALFTIPAASAFAQSSSGQPASPPDATAQPDPSAQPAPAAQPAPSDNAATTPAAPAGAIVPATRADLIPKASVYDSTGGQVGTIESVTSAGAVVFTGVARAQIPVASFSKNAQGLVIGMSKTQLELAVAKASTSKN